MRERKAARRARLRAWGRGKCPPRRMPRPRHRRKIRSDGTPRPAADDARCGRSPGLRVLASPHLPARTGQWQSQSGYPLTVAGAATDSVPSGSSPCSLFMRPASPPSATIAERMAGFGEERKGRCPKRCRRRQAQTKPNPPVRAAAPGAGARRSASFSRAPPRGCSFRRIPYAPRQRVLPRVHRRR